MADAMSRDLELCPDYCRYHNRYLTTNQPYCTHRTGDTCPIDSNDGDRERLADVVRFIDYLKDLFETRQYDWRESQQRHPMNQFYEGAAYEAGVGAQLVDDFIHGRIVP